MDLPAILSDRLTEAARLGRRRELKVRHGIDLSSNDYLGFSEDAALRHLALRRLEGVPNGASGSRLLRGNLALFEAVERQLARFCGHESALLFPSGYQANVGLLSALLSEKDIVFSDELNHASIVDGIRLSRARKSIFPHNDPDTLERELKSTEHQPGLRLIVTESLFSMEGDFAPLPELVRLSKKHGALLVVDESHATGIYGDFARNLGGGLVQELGLAAEVFATVHTGGKALGTGGAWICGSRLLRDYLINRSRAFIYSTAMLPWGAVLIGSAVDRWKQVGAPRAAQALDRAALLRDSLRRRGTGPIVPILIGESLRTLEVSRRLAEAGFDVRAIRPPTVAEGSGRLRITVNSGLSALQIRGFVSALDDLLKESSA